MGQNNLPPSVAEAQNTITCIISFYSSNSLTLMPLQSPSNGVMETAAINVQRSQVHIN